MHGIERQLNIVPLLRFNASPVFSPTSCNYLIHSIYHHMNSGHSLFSRSVYTFIPVPRLKRRKPDESGEFLSDR